MSNLRDATRRDFLAKMGFVVPALLIPGVARSAGIFRGRCGSRRRKGASMCEACCQRMDGAYAQILPPITCTRLCPVAFYGSVSDDSGTMYYYYDCLCCDTTTHVAASDTSSHRTDNTCATHVDCFSPQRPILGPERQDRISCPGLEFFPSVGLGAGTKELVARDVHFKPGPAVIGAVGESLVRFDDAGTPRSFRLFDLPISSDVLLIGAETHHDPRDETAADHEKKNGKHHVLKRASHLPNKCYHIILKK